LFIKELLKLFKEEALQLQATIRTDKDIDKIVYDLTDEEIRVVETG